jgi:transcriptional regulator with XRE-family HTH domain
MRDAHSEAELLYSVRHAIGYRGLTLQEVAHRLGQSSHANLSAAFNGRTRLSLTMLFRIAEALDIGVSVSFSRLENTPGAVLKYPQPDPEPSTYLALLRHRGEI